MMIDKGRGPKKRVPGKRSARHPACRGEAKALWFRQQGPALRAACQQGLEGRPTPGECGGSGAGVRLESEAERRSVIAGNACLAAPCNEWRTRGPQIFVLKTSGGYSGAVCLLYLVAITPYTDNLLSLRIEAPGPPACEKHHTRQNKIARPGSLRAKLSAAVSGFRSATMTAASVMAARLRPGPAPGPGSL